VAGEFNLLPFGPGAESKTAAHFLDLHPPGWETPGFRVESLIFINHDLHLWFLDCQVAVFLMTR
jgi:hypothetical protein